MTPENQQEIFARFPSFFKTSGEGRHFWGFECGDGWLPLIYSLCLDLESLGFKGPVIQVKEKFGGLRFYVSSATPEQFRAIDSAEENSLTTCEECGKVGKRGNVKGSTWIVTRCPEHGVRA